MLAAALVAVAAGVLLLLLLDGGDGGSPAISTPAGTTSAEARPRPATQEELAALAQDRGRPIFWVGPSAGRTYELTQASDGSVYVRYLDRGVAVGDERPSFLTVGTYPQPDAFETVREASRREGAQVEEVGDDGLAVASRSRPNSWYLAYPDSEALVEVFSPRPGRARELVLAERVVPVEA